MNEAGCVLSNISEAIVVRRAWCGCADHSTGAVKQSREGGGRKRSRRDTVPRHCFLKWVPNPYGLFLPVFMGAFFLTLLRAGKEIKDIIIVKAYILSLVQNWQRSHPCGSGFESMWGGPPGFVP